MLPRWERAVYEALGLGFSVLQVLLLSPAAFGLDGPFFWAWERATYFAAWASPVPVWPNQVSPLRRLHGRVGEAIFASPERIAATWAAVTFATWAAVTFAAWAANKLLIRG